MLGFILPKHHGRYVSRDTGIRPDERDDGSVSGVALEPEPVVPLAER